MENIKTFNFRKAKNEKGFDWVLYTYHSAVLVFIANMLLLYVFLVAFPNWIVSPIVIAFLLFLDFWSIRSLLYTTEIVIMDDSCLSIKTTTKKLIKIKWEDIDHIFATRNEGLGYARFRISNNKIKRPITRYYTKVSVENDEKMKMVKTMFEELALRTNLVIKDTSMF